MNMDDESVSDDGNSASLSLQSSAHHEDDGVDALAASSNASSSCPDTHVRHGHLGIKHHLHLNTIVNVCVRCGFCVELSQCLRHHYQHRHHHHRHQRRRRTSRLISAQYLHPRCRHQCTVDCMLSMVRTYASSTINNMCV
jgi:hypothetical protein